MSHLVETMAFVGEVPWHGLGNPLSPQQPESVWLREAGMDWTIEHSDVLFNVSPGGMHILPHTDAKVLYRSDTLAPLSVVSNRYKVVQPHEVLHFYNDLVSAGGFELETAGVLIFSATPCIDKKIGWHSPAKVTSSMTTNNHYFMAMQNASLFWIDQKDIFQA